MSEELDINAPTRIRRASNRIGMQEIDEQDGWVFLSYGAFTCRGTAHSEEKEDMKKCQK